MARALRAGEIMTAATFREHGNQEIEAEVQTWAVLLAILAALVLCIGFVPGIAAAAGAATVGGVVQRWRTSLATRRDLYVPTPAGLRDIGPLPLSATERFLKRTIDIVGAFCGLVVLLPALAVAAIAIKLDSAGPVFFTQDRVGQAGRRFRILKLRTMTTDNDDSEHMAYVAALMRGEAQSEDGVFKLTGDPRVTRVGRTLRKLSVDEIPQLINVLLGHMSLVGPRPPMVEEVRMYDDWAWQRLRAKPGLTGLWQVSGRCELGFRDMVELDLRYQESWSPVLEFSILLKTPAAVLSSRGAA